MSGSSCSSPSTPRGVKRAADDPETERFRLGAHDLFDGCRCPLIFLVHLAGNLDNWDPRVVDDIADP
jgi:hypothetical protein